MIKKDHKRKSDFEKVKLPQKHPPVSTGKVGVLLVNLGTPDATDFWSIRRYLKEFLSDKRVIEVNRVLWTMILNLFILTFRPSKTAKAYKKVWMKEEDKSPLLYFTEKQAEKLSEEIGDEKVIVDYAMRYGNPSIKSKIAHLKEKGCNRLLIVPLYPHYAAATTATVCDEVFRVLMKMRWQPTVRVTHPYADHPLFIDALEKSVKEHMKTVEWKPDLYLVSYHGIPKKYFDKGDPYHCLCHKNTRLLKEKMKLSDDQIITTFQSRFGPEEWLQPYTDETIESLPEKGVKNLVVLCPGFASDCIETLEEIGIEAKQEFIEAGGENFSLVPCLNDSQPSIEFLRDYVHENLLGWV